MLLAHGRMIHGPFAVLHSFAVLHAFAVLHSFAVTHAFMFRHGLPLPMRCLPLLGACVIFSRCRLHGGHRVRHHLIPLGFVALGSRSKGKWRQVASCLIRERKQGFSACAGHHVGVTPRRIGRNDCQSVFLGKLNQRPVVRSIIGPRAAGLLEMGIRNQAGQILIHDVLNIAREHLKAERSGVPVRIEPALQHPLFDVVGDGIVVQLAHKNHIDSIQCGAHIGHGGRRSVAAVDAKVHLRYVVGRGQLGRGRRCENSGEEHAQKGDKEQSFHGSRTG